MIPALFIFKDFAILFLRLGFGLIFVIHGWPKIKDLKTNAQNFEMMGFSPGVFWGLIAAVLEFFGGLLLILGLFTQIAAFLLAVEMLVIIIWKIKGGQAFAGGYEFDLLLALAGLVLATTAGGFYSLEGYWGLWLF